jgi:hypothetical protein
MPKVVDNSVKLAISSLKMICITNEETGRRLGITGKHVGQILKGEVGVIRDDTWDQMLPVLRPLLPAENTSTVNEKSEPTYRTSNPELARLFQWLENDACPEQIAAVLATARAVGLPNESTNSSHSGRAASRSVA